jgi:D-lactate dehydrogenase
MVESMGIPYATLPGMLPDCNILSLHCPLNESTRYLVNDPVNQQNEAGAVAHQYQPWRPGRHEGRYRRAEVGQIGALGIDVYEQEENLFFQSSRTCPIT